MKQEHEGVLWSNETSFWCFNERDNPYKKVGPVKLHHFISNQVEPSNKADCILSFLGNGSKDYMKVCEEHFPKKEKNFDDTIKRITVPQFFQKVGKL